MGINKTPTKFNQAKAAADDLGLIFWGHYIDRSTRKKLPDLFNVVTRTEGKIQLMRVSLSGDVEYPVML